MPRPRRRPAPTDSLAVSPFPDYSRQCPRKTIHDANKFPNWYAKPGNVARTAVGASSFKWAGITPQAPCTMNCSKNAPVASEAGRLKSGIGTRPVHSGIISRPSTHAIMIARLRPHDCEKAPKSVPPMMAPTFEIIVTVDASPGLKCNWAFKNVGRLSSVMVPASH